MLISHRGVTLFVASLKACIHDPGGLRVEFLFAVMLRKFINYMSIKFDDVDTFPSSAYSIMNSLESPDNAYNLMAPLN